jgi:hypothetical protein
MTNEEHDVITRFIQRAAGSSGGSVPSSQALPPVDRDADALIGQLFQQYPEARYRITQLAYVQEQALNAAQQRMQAMQAQLEQSHAQSQSQQGGSQQGGASPWGGAPAQPPQHRGLLAGLFGGGAAASPPPQPQPQYQQPQYQQPQYAPPPSAMMQPQGSGFLGGALRTAAGVAGGLVAGQALMNLFEGGHGGFGGGFGGGGFGGGGFGGPEVVNNETVINEPGATPWGAAPDSYDQGGAPKDDGGGWQNAPDQSAGWQDAPPDAGAGWQDAGQDPGTWDTGSNSDDGGWTDSSSDA